MIIQLDNYTTIGPSDQDTNFFLCLVCSNEERRKLDDILFLFKLLNFRRKKVTVLLNFRKKK